MLGTPRGKFLAVLAEWEIESSRGDRDPSGQSSLPPGRNRHPQIALRLPPAEKPVLVVGDRVHRFRHEVHLVAAAGPRRGPLHGVLVGQAAERLT